ncbi:MAG TPA: ABC transporter ATP-binding protein [Acidimicrobiia bacterium]|nr:ABC transporter ATP-binding protein [Acidimicrobiia bacterium]
MSPAAIEVAGLEFAYPDGRVALRGVDLSVGAGERVAVLGPNGAGKTTLALHLNGILEPRSGSVTVGGLRVVEANLRQVRRMVGLVFQDSNDQLFMPTVEQDVAFGPANSGVSGQELEQQVDDALAAVGATELAGRPAHHLSGGERRRAALATVLSMSPGVLVFDEPTSDLDGAGRRELAATLGSLSLTQLIITHDLSLALELCPRSILIDGGTIVADRPTREMLGDADLLSESGMELPYGFSLDTAQ